MVNMRMRNLGCGGDRDENWRCGRVGDVVLDSSFLVVWTEGVTGHSEVACLTPGCFAVSYQLWATYLHTHITV